MTGIIALWSGTVVDIPNGWALCDGNNGTPDLRNRFVIGAGDTYDPDDSGGASTHNHDFTGDGHTHGIPNTLCGTPGTSCQTLFVPGTTVNSATGTTDTDSHLPPYYALCYIMKL